MALAVNGNGVIIDTTTNKPVYLNGKIATIENTGAMKQKNCRNNPIIPVESATGEIGMARAERPSSAAGRKTYTLQIVNTHATNTYSTIVFDGLGFIADDLSIPTLNGVNVVSGTRGANSLADLASVAQMSAVDIHLLHIRGLTVVPGSGATAANAGTGTPLSAYTLTNSATILEGDYFNWAAKADLSTNATTSPFGLSIDTDGDTYDPSVRKFEVRWQGQAWTGIVIQMPPLTGFTMNIIYNALQKTHIMDLVN